MTTRTSNRLPRGFGRVAGCTGLALLAACSGGGGGGGSPSEDSESFFVTGARYGRPVEENGELRLVSPLSTVETDPVTGNVIQGTLRPLTSEVDLDSLVTLGLGSSYVPRVIPRNAVLILEFNDELDPTSVVPDELDADGIVTENGSIWLRLQDDGSGNERGVAASYSVNENNRRELWINPIVGDAVGFPASPVAFDADGNARADATGFMRITLPKSGKLLRSTSGIKHTGREDRLGNLNLPIGLNPGNEVLDFIAQNELIPTNETFNGFLPDLTAPRIVREFAVDATLDFSDGDSVNGTMLTDASADYDTSANNGSGEWATKQIVLRPGRQGEETLTIVSNTETTLTLNGAFNVAPRDGDEFRLLRAEFFEPDPDNPINLDLFDPNNPQNDNNARLVNFVTAFEIDAMGDVVGEALSLRDPLPAFSELQVQFNEPMDGNSLKQWENFRVALNPDEGTRAERVTRLILSDSQDVVRLQPTRVDDVAGTIEVVGWGPDVQSLQLQITTVPSVGFLQERMSSSAVQDFLDAGILGIKDLGGRPLAFPTSFFDPESPAISYIEPFFTDEAISSFNPIPESRAWSMMVHRFQGRPVTGTDDATGNPGVAYGDQDNMYYPIADVNLQVNGRLAGQPVVFITKVHDDFFPPPDGQFGAFPVGTSTPLISFVQTTDDPPYIHNGARFQQVFRDVDASPGRDGLAGTFLDLYRVSWAPIGGNVTTDTYDAISVYAGHSHFRPITNQNGAGAVDAFYGLNEMFDYSSFEEEYLGGGAGCPGTVTPEGPNHLPGEGNYINTFATGKWKVAQENLFSPPFDNNSYHPWPEFETPFQYNNGDIPDAENEARKAFNKQAGGRPWKDKRVLDGSYDNRGGDSLLFEVRIQPQDTNISAQNGFTFSPGILITKFPMFRVFSRGETGQQVLPDDIANDPWAKCATANSGLRGTDWGDNSRYFAVFDYVKTTSRITSPFVRVFPGNANEVTYFNPLVSPSLEDRPAGTEIELLWSGANNSKGGGGTGYDADLQLANGRANLSFRATFVGNVDTLLAPSFDTVAIPVLVE